MFHFRSIRWRIAVTYTLLTSGIIAGIFFYFYSQVRHNDFERLRRQLTTHALLQADDRELRAGLAEARWQAGDEALATLINARSGLLGARVTLLLPDGTVLADSGPDSLLMDSQSNQPEFVDALANGTGHSSRFSRAFGFEMLYVAAAVMPQPDGRASADAALIADPVGVLRVSMPLADVAARLSPLRERIIVALLLALSASAVIAYFLAERTAGPVRRLIQTAEPIAQGDTGARIAAGSPDEMGQLVRVFNRMADRLEAQVNSTTRERERLIALLDNLVEGVFILDNEGRVRLCNVVAARMVGIEISAAVFSSKFSVLSDRRRLETEGEEPEPSVLGQPLAQVVRDHRVVETLQTCQEDGKQAESIFQWGESTIRAIALPFVAGGSNGFIVFLQDMTELHRLERVRRDFVSNISHELRTPLASLRALTETLRDGALDDPEAAPRFLDRIETEVDALAQMVQELLELSRIESGQVPFRLRPVPVSEIVLTPVERLQPLAARGQVALIVDLPARLPRVYADAERVHQVITNLVHNALKFSAAGASINISAAGDPAGEQVTISVIDTGIGIPAEDQDRIFERFYKTDRARASGGTGLGLAIAKHIVQAHGGRIWVDSVENRGSTFSFTLSSV